MASVVGRKHGSRHRAFRKVIAFESTAQGSSHFRDRGWSLFRPPPGEGRSNAIALVARTSKLGALPSLSCVMLRAYGTARRCSVHCREVEGYHAGPNPKWGTLEGPRESKLLF